MRMKKLLIVASLLLVGLVVLVGGTSASAKTQYISTIPKSMRGTWYGYNYGKIVTFKIKAHSITYKESGYKTSTGYLHKYVYHEPTKMSKKEIKRTAKWFYMYKTRKIHGYRWIGSYGWHQSAGAGEYYAVSTYKGHKVLTFGAGAEIAVLYHNFRTKALAEKYKHTKLPKFKYYD